MKIVKIIVIIISLGKTKSITNTVPPPQKCLLLKKISKSQQKTQIRLTTSIFKEENLFIYNLKYMYIYRVIIHNKY